MKKFLKYLIVVGFLLFLAGLLFFQFNSGKQIFNQENSKDRYTVNDSGYAKKTITINDVSVVVDIADTTKKQEQGLSGREPLTENEGMLFVFNHSDEYYFWMKEMNFSIDIIWFDENQKIIYIQKEANPESYPVLFGPKQNSKYVLEVFSGFVDKNNLKIGDSFKF